MVKDLQADLKRPPPWGGRGILEPKTEKYTGKIETILVPGLAFDIKGNRLVYGKEDYDRFLSKQTCSKIGIGFKEQLTWKLLTKPHNEQVLILYCPELSE